LTLDFSLLTLVDSIATVTTAALALLTHRLSRTEKWPSVLRWRPLDNHTLLSEKKRQQQHNTAPACRRQTTARPPARTPAGTKNKQNGRGPADDDDDQTTPATCRSGHDVVA